MSRGLGKVQARTLALLREKGELDPLELAGIVYGVEPDAAGIVRVNDAQCAAVRRALTTLQQRGLAFRTGFNTLGRSCWRDRAAAVEYVDRVAQAFGNSALRDYPRPLQEAWADSRTEGP